MKKVILGTAVLLTAALLQSFCGFYVAKANTKLYNKQSEVILVRKADRTTVTMNNDFQGNAKDFAIVVPVPTILKEKDIKVVRADIFDKLNEYSEPRLVEYYDENPCFEYNREDMLMEVAAGVQLNDSNVRLAKKEKELGVTIEAKYTVGEYDILILSAVESNGLKTWLTQNGYKIPAQAEEVLDPYIKNNLKFFVVKVNLEEMHRLGREKLSPIQISYTSDRFMLPIRLGMANSNGTQDMVVYAFTEKGRLECTNYRTAKIPTDINIPEFIKSDFGQFYADLFNKQYQKKGRNAVFLEYAWDLSSSNYVKCDPCSTVPPKYSELAQAGVFFIDYSEPNGWQGSDYSGNLFFTRLHVRYDRENFPMDLQFQETPNTESFQARYVMNHAITEKLDCENADTYYNSVLDRRENELDNLASLTGWDVSVYSSYLNEFRGKLGLPKLAKNEMKQTDPLIQKAEFQPIWVLLIIGISAVLLFVRFRKKRIQ